MGCIMLFDFEEFHWDCNRGTTPSSSSQNSRSHFSFLGNYVFNHVLSKLGPFFWYNSYCPWDTNCDIVGHLQVKKGSKTVKLYQSISLEAYTSKALMKWDFRQNNMRPISYLIQPPAVMQRQLLSSCMFVVWLWLHVVTKETANPCCFFSHCCCMNSMQQDANVVQVGILFWVNMVILAPILLLKSRPIKFSEHCHKIFTHMHIHILFIYTYKYKKVCGMENVYI